VYAVFWEESAILGRTFLRLIYIYVYLYPVLNGYGGDVRRMWSSYGLTNCTCLMWCVIHTLCRFILGLIAKPYSVSHMVSVLCKVLGTLRTIFMTLLQIFLAYN